MKIVSNPGGLNAFRGRSKLQSFVGRSPDLEINCLHYPAVVSRSLITVARPHGILTRFPILPNLLGHPDAFNYKERFVIDADTITLALTVSIPEQNSEVICWGRFASAIGLQ